MRIAYGKSVNTNLTGPGLSARLPAVFAEVEGGSSLAQQPFGGAAIPGERVRAPLRGGAPARRGDRTSWLLANVGSCKRAHAKDPFG
jgi:hypothetical protein